MTQYIPTYPVTFRLLQAEVKRRELSSYYKAMDSEQFIKIVGDAFYGVSGSITNSKIEGMLRYMSPAARAEFDKALKEEATRMGITIQQ